MELFITPAYLMPLLGVIVLEFPDELYWKFYHKVFG